MADVRFSRKALADLAAIHAWLAERNPAAAERGIPYQRLIREAIERAVRG